MYLAYLLSFIFFQFAWHLELAVGESDWVWVAGSSEPLQELPVPNATGQVICCLLLQFHSYFLQSLLLSYTLCAFIFLFGCTICLLPSLTLPLHCPVLSQELLVLALVHRFG